MPEPSEAQQVIRERQDDVDVEADDAQLIEEAVRDQLADLSYDPDSDCVHLPAAILTDWINRGMHEKSSTSKVGRLLRQLSEEGRFTYITPNRCKTHGRGFLWFNPDERIRTDVKNRVDRRNGKGYSVDF